jgi:hypothetical protein
LLLQQGRTEAGIGHQDVVRPLGARTVHQEPDVVKADQDI